MSEQLKSIIKHDDFVELKYQVTVRNTTTNTDVKPSTPITITELRPKGVVLRLPAKACTAGHMLLLQIVPKDNRLTKPRPDETGGQIKRATKSHEQLAKEKDLAHREFLAVVIEITAKTTLVQITDDGCLLVEASFYQFDEKRWRKFTDSFDARQDNIHRLVKTIKE